MSFALESRLSGTLGRAGVLTTPHGVIHTPAFVAVGTKATVKALTPDQIAATGSEVVLGNTYHLYLEPGEKIVGEAGGLGKFMGWSGPTMTDSGGFQVFSLGTAFGKKANKFIGHRVSGAVEGQRTPLAHIDDNGVTFRSYKDGSVHRFTPERSIEIQHVIGADIIFAFDECTSPEASEEYQKEAMDRTHRWAKRSLAQHKKLGGEQVLFGVVQGGRHEDLRKESARTIAAMDFDGFGIGGSFDKADMGTAVRWVSEILPEEKPRHLLGIGDPLDLFEAVENGCDLFDCVAPMREARTGALYTKHGRINIENARYKIDFSAIEDECDCYTCKNGFTKAYLAHLFRSEEILASTLATIHNLRFIVKLVDGMRQGILDSTFEKYKDKFLSAYKK